MGCSTHSVPSWSKVAMRSAGGTNCGLPCVVVTSTNLTMASLAAPSFQEGSGSVWARTWVPDASPKTTASTNTSGCRAFHFMSFSSGWPTLGWSERPPDEDARPFRSEARLVARVAALALELLYHLVQVVAGGGLQRRERPQRLEPREPQLLADRQEVPVVDEGRRRRTKDASDAHGRLLVDAHRLLERIALDVLHQREVERDERHDPAGRPGLRHGVVHLPVLVADGRRRGTREVVEDVARRVRGLALEIVPLVEAIQRGLDDAGVLAGLDPLLQTVARGPAGNVDEGGHPVEGGEELVVHRARLDVAWPPDDAGGAIAALPGFTLLALEGCDAAVGEGDGLGAVVGGEDHDGVIELTHVFELLEDDADVVVQLLHACLVETPVLAALLADHGLVLGGEHGGDVHARGVIPDEERFVRLLGIIAVEEVDHLGRDLLVHGLRPLQGQRALVLARLALLRAVRRCAPDHRPRGRQAR